MAITVTSHTLAGGYGWAVNGTSADASSCEELRAAPGSGVSLCLRSVTINAGFDGTVTVGEDESGNNVVTPLVGPVSCVDGTVYPVLFNPPIELTANKSLTVDASGAGAVCVLAQGYTR